MIPLAPSWAIPALNPTLMSGSGYSSKGNSPVPSPGAEAFQLHSQAATWAPGSGPSTPRLSSQQDRYSDGGGGSAGTPDNRPGQQVQQQHNSGIRPVISGDGIRGSMQSSAHLVSQPGSSTSSLPSPANSIGNPSRSVAAVPLTATAPQQYQHHPSGSLHSRRTSIASGASTLSASGSISKKSLQLPPAFNPLPFERTAAGAAVLATARSRRSSVDSAQSELKHDSAETFSVAKTGSRHVGTHAAVDTERPASALSNAHSDAVSGSASLMNTPAGDAAPFIAWPEDGIARPFVGGPFASQQQEALASAAEYSHQHQWSDRHLQMQHQADGHTRVDSGYGQHETGEQQQEQWYHQHQDAQQQQQASYSYDAYHEQQVYQEHVQYDQQHGHAMQQTYDEHYSHHHQQLRESTAAQQYQQHQQYFQHGQYQHYSEDASGFDPEGGGASNDHNFGNGIAPGGGHDNYVDTTSGSLPAASFISSVPGVTDGDIDASGATAHGLPLTLQQLEATGDTDRDPWQHAQLTDGGHDQAVPSPNLEPPFRSFEEAADDHDAFAEGHEHEGHGHGAQHDEGTAQPYQSEHSSAAHIADLHQTSQWVWDGHQHVMLHQTYGAQPTEQQGSIHAKLPPGDAAAESSHWDGYNATEQLQSAEDERAELMQSFGTNGGQDGRDDLDNHGEVEAAAAEVGPSAGDLEPASQFAGQQGAVDEHLHGQEPFGSSPTDAHQRAVHSSEANWKADAAVSAQTSTLANFFDAPTDEMPAAAASTVFQRPATAPKFAVIRSDARDMSDPPVAFFGQVPGQGRVVPQPPRKALVQAASVDEPATFFSGAADHGPSSLARFGVNIRTVDQTANRKPLAGADGAQTTDSDGDAGTGKTTRRRASTGAALVSTRDMFGPSVHDSDDATGNAGGSSASSLENLFGLVEAAAGASSAYGASGALEYDANGEYVAAGYQQPPQTSLFASAPSEHLSPSTAPSAMDFFATSPTKEHQQPVMSQEFAPQSDGGYVQQDANAAGFLPFDQQVDQHQYYQEQAQQYDGYHDQQALNDGFGQHQDYPGSYDASPTDVGYYGVNDGATGYHDQQLGEGNSATEAAPTCPPWYTPGDAASQQYRNEDGFNGQGFEPTQVPHTSGSAPAPWAQVDAGHQLHAADQQPPWASAAASSSALPPPWSTSLVQQPASVPPWAQKDLGGAADQQGNAAAVPASSNASSLPPANVGFDPSTFTATPRAAAAFSVLPSSAPSATVPASSFCSQAPPMAGAMFTFDGDKAFANEAQQPPATQQNIVGGAPPTGGVVGAPSSASVRPADKKGKSSKYAPTQFAGFNPSQAASTSNGTTAAAATQVTDQPSSSAAPWQLSSQQPAASIGAQQRVFDEAAAFRGPSATASPAASAGNSAGPRFPGFARSQRPTCGAFFGFGGRLVVVRTGSPSVALHPLGMILANDPAYQSLVAFPGPLTLDGTPAKVHTFLASQEGAALESSSVIARAGTLGSSDRASDLRLLHSVLDLLVEHGGTVPLAYPPGALSASSSNPQASAAVKRVDAASAALVKAFAAVAADGDAGDYAAGWSENRVVAEVVLRHRRAIAASSDAANDAATADMSRIQQLLAGGDKAGALDAALLSRQWSHALLIAASLSKEAYLRTVTAFSGSALHATSAGAAVSSSLSILYPLLAGDVSALVKQPLTSLPAQPSSTSDADVASRAELLRTWRSILSSVVSNRITAALDPRALVAIGDRLWTEGGSAFAAHALFLLAGATIEAPSPASRMVLVGSDHRAASPLASPALLRDPFALQRTEILAFARRRSTAAGASAAAPMPSLQPLKLMYAMLLADMGLLKEAARYVTSIRAGVKESSAAAGSGHNNGVGVFNPLFLAELDALDDRLAGCGSTGIGATGRWEGVASVAAGVAAAVAGSAFQGLKHLFNTAATTVSSSRPGSRRPSKDSGQQQAEQPVAPAAQPPSSIAPAASVAASNNNVSAVSTTSTSSSSGGGLLSSLSFRGIFRSKSDAGGGSSSSLDGTKSKGPKVVNLGNPSAANQPEPYYDDAQKRWIFPGEENNAPAAAMGPPPTAAVAASSNAAAAVGGSGSPAASPWAAGPSSSPTDASTATGTSMQPATVAAGSVTEIPSAGVVGGARKKGARMNRYVDTVGSASAGVGSGAAAMPPPAPAMPTAAAPKPAAKFAVFAPAAVTPSPEAGQSHGWGPAFEQDSVLQAAAAKAAADAAAASSSLPAGAQWQPPPITSRTSAFSSQQQSASSSSSWEPSAPKPPRAGQAFGAPQGAGTGFDANGAASGVSGGQSDPSTELYGAGAASFSFSAGAASLPSQFGAGKDGGGAAWDF